MAAGLPVLSDFSGGFFLHVGGRREVAGGAQQPLRRQVSEAVVAVFAIHGTF